jgi:hypothetical protein
MGCTTRTNNRSFPRGRKDLVLRYTPYRHPESMKEQEEGNPIFNEKRLHQLNFLSDTVGKRMRDVAAAAVAGEVKTGVENTNSKN